MEWFMLEEIKMTMKDGLHLDLKNGVTKKFYLFLKKLKHGQKEKMNIEAEMVYFQ